MLMDYSKNSEQLPEWNRDEVWTKIEDRLQRKKRRRGFAFWWFGLGLILIGAGFYFTKTNESKTEISQKEMQFAQIPNENDIDKTEWKDLNEFEIKKAQLTDNQIPKNQKSTLGTISKKGDFSEKTDFLSSTFGNNKPNFNTKKDNIPKRILEQKGPHYEEEILDTQSSETSEKNQNPVAVFDKLKTEILFLDIEPSNLELPVPQSRLIKKTGETDLSKNILFVEFGSGFGTVKYLDQPVLKPIRQQTETFRFSTNTTVGIERHFEKNWFLKTGITFQTFFEKYDHVADSLDTQLVQNDTATIYDLGNGNLFIEPGIRTITTKKKRAIVHNNFIYRWSLPISAGYVFKIKKARIAADLGIRIRGFQKFSGITTGANGQHLFSNEINTELLYSNQLDIGLMAGLSARYPISKNTSLGFRAGFEQEDFLNITKDKRHSRYQIFNANLGCYRQF